MGGASTSHDARGNFLSGGVGRTYAYNADNELTGITGGTASTLSYDPAGRLILQTGTQHSRYLYDGDQVIAAYDGGTGALTQRFVPSDWIDERAATFMGTTVTNINWASIDERGSVLNAQNASGGVVGINIYDAYGLPGPGNIGRFGYTGQMWLPDAQAWHYKARAYHPGLGRFLQTDPIGYGDGLNIYAYVRGDPTNRIDPWGLSSLVHGDWVTPTQCTEGRGTIQYRGARRICYVPGGTAVPIGSGPISGDGGPAGSPQSQEDACASAPFSRWIGTSAFERMAAEAMEKAKTTPNIGRYPNSGSEYSFFIGQMPWGPYVSRFRTSWLEYRVNVGQLEGWWPFARDVVLFHTHQSEGKHATYVISDGDYIWSTFRGIAVMAETRDGTRYCYDPNAED